MMLVNGAPAEAIPATDRGLAYGDGVFRTLRARHGEPLHWPRHYAKLCADAMALDIPCPDEAHLLAEVRAVARTLPEAVVKIIVTRGSGTRGYVPPSVCAPMRVVTGSQHTPVAQPGDGIQLHLCRLRLAHQPALAGIKHLNRLENVMARAEWSDAEISEGLLLDQDGLAISGTMSNLFIVERGALLTPPLSQCGVAGVTRARVLEIAEKLQWACHVMPLPLERVMDADAVFLVNSIIGLWPVARLGVRHWQPARFAAEMREALEEDDAELA